MLPAVIVLDSGDVLTFDAIADAESYIEPYDLDVYRIFDSDGRRLGATARGRRVTLHKPDADAPREDALLAASIHKYLDELGWPGEPAATLSELLAIVHPLSRTR